MFKKTFWENQLAIWSWQWRVLYILLWFANMCYTTFISVKCIIKISHTYIKIKKGRNFSSKPMPTGFIGKAFFPSSLNYALVGCGCLFQDSCLLWILNYSFTWGCLSARQIQLNSLVSPTAQEVWTLGHKSRMQFRIQAAPVVTELSLIHLCSNPLFSFLYVCLVKEKLHWIAREDFIQDYCSRGESLLI